MLPKSYIPLPRAAAQLLTCHCYANYCPLPSSPKPGLWGVISYFQGTPLCTPSYYEKRQLLFADKETEVQRTVPLAKVPQLLTVFQLQVPGPFFLPGSHPVEQGKEKEEGQWAEVRGKFSELRIPVEKQC